MSVVPTMVDLPIAGYDQPMQGLFRLAGQSDGVICHQPNADGSGFIFVNGTFQLLSADEYSRYLLGLPLGVNMDVDAPVTQSPESVGSSIYSLTGLANVPAFEEVSKDCQPGCVPPTPCNADGFDMSLDSVQDDLQLYPAVLDLFPSTPHAPAQVDDSEFPVYAFSDAPLNETPVCTVAGTVQPESTTNAEDAAKHKLLFGGSGILDSDEQDHRPPPVIRIPRREPKRGIPHGFDLQFLSITVAASMPGSGKDKRGYRISLGPFAQAVFFFELNLLLIEAINAFLVEQNKKGHIPRQTIDSVNRHWSFKGFPPVVDFLWDLGHQRSLFGMNLEKLQFTGQSSVDPVHLRGILGGWKILAGDVRKNFAHTSDCVPDALVHRHLETARELLEAINVPEETFTAFFEFHDHAKLLMPS